MPDTNVRHPSERVSQYEEVRRMFELDQLQRELHELRVDMEAIFSRIASGQSVELRYPDGTIRTVAEVADGKAPSKAETVKPPRKPRRTKAEIEAAKFTPTPPTPPVTPGNAETAAKAGVEPEIPDFLNKSKQAAE